MTRSNTRRSFLAGLVLAAAATACVSSTPEHPLPLKLTTEPPGAEVELVDQGILLVTPCSFPMDFSTYDKIVVRKAGYRPFEGSLRKIYQIARGSYELKLIPE